MEMEDHHIKLLNVNRIGNFVYKQCWKLKRHFLVLELSLHFCQLLHIQLPN